MRRLKIELMAIGQVILSLAFAYGVMFGIAEVLQGLWNC